MTISGLFCVVFNKYKVTQISVLINAWPLLEGQLREFLTVLLLVLWMRGSPPRGPQSLLGHYTLEVWGEGQGKGQASGVGVRGQSGHFSQKGLKIIMEGKETVKRLTLRNMKHDSNGLVFATGKLKCKTTYIYHSRHGTRIIGVNKHFSLASHH